MSHVTRTVTGAATVTTVVGSMTNVSPGSAGTFTIGSATGWPTGTFAVIVDYGLPTQETILCSARTGTTCTVATSGRGYDGSTAQAHSAGASVEHVFDFTAFTALLEHVNSDAGLDHSGYRLASAVGLVGDIVKLVPAGTAVAGATGRYADAGHAHPIDAIPTFHTYRSGSQNISDSTATVMQMNAVDRDTHSGITGSGGSTFRYTIPAAWAGVWEFSMGAEYVFNATGYRQATIRKNGVATDLTGSRTIAVTTAATPTVVAATVILDGLAAGDYLQPFALQNSGAGLNIVNGVTLQTFFAGRWVRP